MAKPILALFGDSILDNGSYTRPEPDTAAHLQRILSEQFVVRRFAQDGATMSDLYSQLEGLREELAVAVLSIGGNDAIEHVELLDRPGSNSGALLDDLEIIGTEFQRRYEAVVRAIVARADRTILCSIYEAQLEPPALARRARVPLAVLNDRIVRVAVQLGVDVLELRSICTEASDFVKQIEPSPRGAAKIAAAIASVVRGDGIMKCATMFAA